MENQRNGEAEVKVASKSSLRISDLVIRLFITAATIVAAVVLGVDKQTKMMTLQVSPTLPPMTIPVTAKWNYFNACVYFVVANAIASAYTALSIIVIVATRNGKKKGLSMLIMTMDLLMVALLFSALSACCAVGILAFNGNSHVQWNKVCNTFRRFCFQVVGAVVVSLLGSLAFLLLVFLATLKLHRKHH